MKAKLTTRTLPGLYSALLPREAALSAINAAIALTAVCLAVVLQRKVDWMPFASGYAATLGLAAIGMYVRSRKNTPRLALALIGFAIYAGFTAVSLVFVFVLLPLGRPLVDPTLISIDSVLGYDWPTLVAWLAGHPDFGRILGFVYLSSQQQLIFTILLLSFLSRSLALHRFLAVGMITLGISVAIWWVAPSVGPSAFMFVPESDVRAIGLHFTPDFGAVLRGLIQNGPSEVSPETITGIIAFPSYHIIMASMAVWFSRGTLAFIPLALLNVLMVPATLSHGAHHLVDIIGGFVVFGFGVWLAERLFRDSV